MKPPGLPTSQKTPAFHIDVNLLPPSKPRYLTRDEMKRQIARHLNLGDDANVIATIEGPARGGWTVVALIPPFLSPPNARLFDDYDFDGMLPVGSNILVRHPIEIGWRHTRDVAALMEHGWVAELHDAVRAEREGMYVLIDRRESDRMLLAQWDPPRASP